jgi:hypothetical protein
MSFSRVRTASLAYLGVYVFVMYVAFVTSGTGLMKEPDILYPVFIPPLSAGCFLTSSYMNQPARKMLFLGIPAHLLAVVAFFESFLGLGFALIAVAYFWWRAYLSAKSEREAG